MGYSFWKFATVAVAFAGAASSQQTAPVNTTTQLMEVDIVFPRNETYRLTEIIPIVLAVQNLPTGKVNNTTMTWGWEIVPYAYGVVPWDYPYDMGTFEVLPNDSPAMDQPFSSPSPMSPSGITTSITTVTKARTGAKRTC